jgi:TatD DNase family protein
MPFFDTHAHLFDERFANDCDAVIQRAAPARVEGILAVGIDAASSVDSLAIARKHKSIFAAVGIQPNSAAEAKTTDWDGILAMAEDAKVLALGETGLDRYWDKTPFAMQEDYFARHLALSRKLNKPVVIHCREAEADVVRMLREDFGKHGPVRGVMHSFTGDAIALDACLAMGLFISFAGMVTYKTAADLRTLSKRVPADRLLIETDCPYLAPVPERGKRNEPAFIVHTAACLAKERGEPLEELGRVTTANARRLLGL